MPSSKQIQYCCVCSDIDSSIIKCTPLYRTGSNNSGADDYLLRRKAKKWRYYWNFPKERGVCEGVLEFGQMSSECWVECKRENGSPKRRATRAAWSQTAVCGTEQELVALRYKKRITATVVVGNPDKWSTFDFRHGERQSGRGIGARRSKRRQGRSCGRGRWVWGRCRRPTSPLKIKHAITERNGIRFRQKWKGEVGVRTYYISSLVCFSGVLINEWKQKPKPERPRSAQKKNTIKQTVCVCLAAT